jgi:catechol 2,3-dioxygenase-like lactoylglutathione lyase family enzyme
MSIFREPQLILFTADLPRITAFYRRLGFAEVFRTPEEGDPIHVDLVLDSWRVGFSTATSSRDDHGLDPIAAGQRAAVILWTDDTPSAYDELLAQGATALKPPHVWLDRLLIAWAADPDGNPVQVVQRL